MREKIYLTKKEAIEKAIQAPVFVATGGNLRVELYPKSLHGPSVILLGDYVLGYGGNHEWWINVDASIRDKSKFVNTYISQYGKLSMIDPRVTVWIPKHHCENGYFKPGVVRNIRCQGRYLSFYFNCVLLCKEE